MSELQREVSIQRPRCPFCHDEVLTGQDKTGCGACMAWHHALCWSEHGACSACGATDPGGGDQVPAQPGPGASAPGKEEVDPEILAALAQGKLIQAIKRHRELHGSSLKEAKQAIDALRGPGAGVREVGGDSPHVVALILGLLVALAVAAIMFMLMATPPQPL